MLIIGMILYDKYSFGYAVKRAIMKNTLLYPFLKIFFMMTFRSVGLYNFDIAKVHR